ncbi:MAG: futalosine hydrolase, partial [Bacteroidota bacterium]|nr:futalosine hydrolase [Bacteroidota bacterium]
MKLLIVASSLKDIQAFLEKSGVALQQHVSLKFMHQGKILHHEVDILESGVGIYQTTYKLTKVLAIQKYHLALKIGFGNAYKDEITIGAVLNIVNEKPGDFGMMLNTEWKDHYDFELLKRTDEPHVRGGFVNLTNAYMNVFMPYKKSVGITVNHYADKNSLELRREKYMADCETGDGLGFVYPCLFEKQS